MFILDVCGGMPDAIINIISKVINIIKIVVPIGIVVFGMIDFVKAVTSQKDDEITKGQKVFIKRLLSGVLTFFVIAIVQLVLHVVDTNGTNEALACLNSILNGTGGTSYGGGAGGSGGTTTKTTTTMNSECTEDYLRQYNGCLSSGYVPKTTCDANYPMCVSKTTTTTTKNYLTTTKINKTEVVADAVAKYLLSAGIGDAAYIAGVTKVCSDEFAKAWKAEIEDWDVTAHYVAKLNCGKAVAKLTIEKYKYNYNIFISMVDDIISGLGMKPSYEACRNKEYYDTNILVDDKLVNCIKREYCDEHDPNMKKCQEDILSVNSVPKNGETCYDLDKLIETNGYTLNDEGKYCKEGKCYSEKEDVIDKIVSSSDYYEDKSGSGGYCIANYSITNSYETIKAYCIAEATKCIELAAEK